MAAAKILIVEDELQELFREAMELLCGGDHTVYTASAGDSGVRKARAIEPDVIVMDLRLPFKNGVKAIEEIRRFNSHAKIFALTAYNDDFSRKAALEAGADKYFVKPVDFKELLRAVKEAVDERSSGKE